MATTRTNIHLYIYIYTVVASRCYFESLSVTRYVLTVGLQSFLQQDWLQTSIAQQ